MNIIDGYEVVAHYTKSKWLGDILGKKQIKLSKISGFDDPRESSLDWISVVGIGHKTDGWREASDMKESAGKKINILCTCIKSEAVPGECTVESASYGRPRMWSQYGENSKGFCVVLNKEKLRITMREMAEKTVYFMDDEVDYSMPLSIIGGDSVIEYGEGIDIKKYDLFEKINGNYMLRSTLFYKGSDWRDECEHRWLLFSDSEEELCVFIEDCIEAVVLGCKFDPEKIGEAIRYSRNLDCPCFMLSYQHPQYKLISI